MSQRFVKGWTNNHLTWVMVDSTDFATPESAMSAATKLTIYGKVKGATTLHTVSTGTGSLTNDILHVGPSATGIYTIALAKADLSDASQAWYDHYIVAISATGAAHQVVIVDGGAIASYLSAVGSDALSGVVALSDAVSNVHSELTSQFAVFSNYLSSISAIASDAHSAAILGASHASEAQSHATLAASRVLLVQSRLSDFMSAIYPSDISDIRSMLTALSDAISNVDSAVNSQYSDIESKLTSVHSDLKSAVGNVSVTITASDISDIASAVADAVGLTASQIADKVWSDYGSKVGVTPSQAYSYTSNALSDILSTMGSQFAVTSDYLSSISAIASNAHSAAILAASTASEAQSNILLVQSRLSDFTSAVYPSDISSIQATLASLSGMLSDIDSAANSQYSDLDSKLTSQFAAISDAISNVDSALTSQYSDVLSTLTSVHSDLKSAVGAVSVAISASDISDLASQVVEAIASAALDVNVVRVKGHSVIGSGTQDDPWRPA